MLKPRISRKAPAKIQSRQSMDRLHGDSASEWQHLLSAAALLALTFSCFAPLGLAQSPDLPPGAAQAKAKTACLECHDASIIIQQRLSKAAWTKEVDKMIKWGALVDATDRDSFIDYLSANFPPDKPPAEMPRTAPVKKR